MTHRDEQTAMTSHRLAGVAQPCPLVTKLRVRISHPGAASATQLGATPPLRREALRTFLKVR